MGKDLLILKITAAIWMPYGALWRQSASKLLLLFQPPDDPGE